MPPVGSVRTYIRHGQPYTSYGSGLKSTPTPPVVMYTPAVVTAATYIPKKKQSAEPTDVDPSEIFEAMAKLVVKPRALKRKS